MNIIDLVSLDFLWKYLSPILSDSIKDRIKPKTSTQRAKVAVHNLYSELGVLLELTDKFVDALTSYAITAGKSKEATDEDNESWGEKVSRTKSDLEYAGYALMARLPRLSDYLYKVNPQLEIHKYELVQQFNMYMRTRLDLINEVNVSINDLPVQDFERLQAFVFRAKQNRDRLFKSIEEYRGFLAQEFPFKDSF